MTRWVRGGVDHLLAAVAMKCSMPQCMREGSPAAAASGTSSLHPADTALLLLPTPGAECRRTRAGRSLPQNGLQAASRSGAGARQLGAASDSARHSRGGASTKEVLASGKKATDAAAALAGVRQAAALVELLLGVGQQVVAMPLGSRAARLLLSRPRRQPSSSSGSRERLASSHSSGSREHLSHHHDSSSSSSGRSRPTSRRSSSRRSVTRTAGSSRRSSRPSSSSRPAGWVGCRVNRSNTGSRPLLQHACKGAAAAAADLLGTRSSQQGTSHLSSSMQARHGTASSLPQCRPGSQPKQHIHSRYGSCSSPSSRHQLWQAGVQLAAAAGAAQLGWLGTMRQQHPAAAAAAGSGPDLDRTMTGDAAV